MSTQDTDTLDSLYNPSISDLELDEHRGDDRPVIYLAGAKKVLANQRREADRQTLETISALLNGDSNQVDVIKGYIRNKLEVYEHLKHNNERTS